MEIKNKSQIVLVIFLGLFFAAVVSFNLNIHGEQQFSLLAGSFLKGKLYFTELPGSLGDTSPYAGKYYWPLGPFPAMVLMPFVYVFELFGRFFYQGYMQIVWVFGVFYLVCKISKLFQFNNEDSLYLALAFCFASVFIGVALMPWSWYFSQVITTFLLLYILLEFFGKKRPLVLGSITGVLLLTRIPASLVFLIYILGLIQDRKTKYKIRKAVCLLIPCAISATLLFVYNYLRFGNPFEQGYAFQLISRSMEKARDIGIFSFAHVPSNLYYLLLAGPLPVFKVGASHLLGFPFIRADPWGMSLFVTSPYFIYLLFQKYKEWPLRNLIVVSTVISIPIIFYYGIGFRQFGYRYSLDFMPLLFVVFIKKYSEAKQKLSSRMKFLVIVSALFNMYLFLSIFSGLLGNPRI